MTPGGLLRQEARDLVAVEHEEVRALGGYRAVSGHFLLTTLLQIADAASIATVLREPRVRLLSLYMYWRVPGVGFVGVLELGDSVWRGLGRLFGVELDPTELNATEELGGLIPVGPGDCLLTPEALDLIEQRSAADLPVYDHVLGPGAVMDVSLRLGSRSFTRPLR